MPDQPTYDCFLSYSRHDDEPFVKKLRDALGKRGFKVWWDKAAMEARGTTFHDEIIEAIKDSRRLVLVCGPEAVKSTYVRQEWEYAQKFCKVINPILRLGDYNAECIPAPFLKENTPDFRQDIEFERKLAELERLLRSDDLPIGTLYGVPLLPTHYVTRQTALDAVEKLIRTDSFEPVVVTAKRQVTAVHGMGGIGKSVLAAALAQDCDIRRRFPDGIVWVAIGKTPEIATRLGDIGVTLGDSRDEYPDETRGKVALGRLLGEKSALIILDDVWQHAHADPFRVPSARSRILVTTRSRQLAMQIGAQEYRLDVLTEAEGLALFAERLDLDLGLDTPDEPDTGAVGAHPDAPAPIATLRAIIHELGGHTQAVALAAAQLAGEGVAYAPELLARLQKRRDGETPFKDLNLGDDDDRDFNLEAMLSLSYDDLPDDDLRLRFRALGVFALEGTFDAAAAGGVWGDGDVDDAADALRELERRSMIVRREDGRWALHGLVRTYARALARRAHELDDTLARHFGYYFRLHGDYDTNNDEDRHPLISIDFDNLRAALDWGFEHEPARAADLVVGFDYYMLLRESLTTQRTLLERGREAANAAGHAQGEASILLRIGNLNVREDRLSDARQNYEQALPIYETIGARLGQANTLVALGDLNVREDRLSDARQNYEQA
ncbi:MAG: TIR domain-containing protein, partial [Anaerolineae bacterium]|nr:TIR domain-containing protein [Anaerolineae bacterium]